MRMVVLLPEPLPPRNAKMVPGATARLRSSTAVKSPKRFVRPTVRMIGSLTRAPPASPSSVASMSTGSCSAKRTAPPARPARSRSTRAAPGDCGRRTSTRALAPVARAPAT